MFHNINQYNVEHIVKCNRNSPLKTLNNQFVKMISMIRALEDQLITEQYNHELLNEENFKYQNALKSIRKQHEQQQMKISSLEKQLNSQMKDNCDLQECQQSLKSIFSQIESLQQTVQARNRQCQVLKQQIYNLLTTNQKIEKQNLQMSQIHINLSQSIIKSVQQTSKLSLNHKTMPLMILKQQIKIGKQQLNKIQAQQGRLKRQRAYLVNNQKQAIIKLKYQCSLQQQRNNDCSKIQQFTRTCQNQEKLQTIIQSMLIKQDELLQELDYYRYQHRQIEKQYQIRRNQMRQKQEQESENSERELSELKSNYEKHLNELKHEQKMLHTTSQKYRSMMIEQQISWKVNLNLSTLKRLRQAQQRNKHLKLNISGLQQIKVLLQEQKSLFHQPT